MKRWIPVIIPLAVLGGLIYWRVGQKNEAGAKQQEQREAKIKAPKPVTLLPVQVRDIVQTYSAVGSVEAPLSVQITPKVAGRIEFLQVREGDIVRRGQVLASLDPAEIEAEVRRQQANVAEARYRWQQAKINSNPAVVAVMSEIRRQEVELASAQSALQQAIASDRAQRTGAQASVADASGRIKNADAGTGGAQADYEQAKGNLAAQIATAEAAVTDAQGRVNNAKAQIASAQADYNQAKESYNEQLAAAQASVGDAQGRVEAAEAAIASAGAQIGRAQADLDNARTKYNRVYALYKQAFIAAQEVDDARAAVKVAQSALEVAQQQQEGAKAQRQSALAQKQAAQKQADIVASRGKADIEVARTKVEGAEAARDSAAAQLEAARRQVEIARTKGNADVEVARSKVLQARAAQDSAVAQRRSAEEQAKVIGSKSDVDIDAARSHIAQTQASLRQARSNLALKSSSAQNLAALQAVIDAAEAELRAARTRLADATLRSPLDGVVTERKLDPGAMAAPGQQIVTVQSLAQVWVSFAIPEEITRQVSVGQSVQVAFDALPNRQFTSRIARVNPSADPQSRQFTARVTLDNPGGTVKPGMFGRVTLVTQRLQNAIVVPREAVQLTSEGDAQSGTVVVINQNSESEKRQITLGASDPKGFQVIEGLEPGEKVVVMTTAPLRAGQKVKTGKGGEKGAGGKPEESKPEAGKGEGAR